MTLGLRQTAETDIDAFLDRLAKALPPEIAERVFIVLEEATALPRPLLVLEPVEDGDVDALDAALETLQDPAIALDLGSRDEPAGPPAAESSAPPLELDIVPYSKAVALDGLEDILAAKPSGVDFPEKAYEGLHKKHYDKICKVLGAVPMEDRGRTLAIGDFNNLPEPKRRGKNLEIWTEVRDHLREETRAFIQANRWFDDGGHLRNALRDHVVVDKDFVERLNSSYGLIKTSEKVSYSTKLGEKMALAAISKLPGGGSMMALVLGLVWDAARNADGGADVIKAAIRDMKHKIAARFTATIDVIETCHTQILQDWGNLSAFMRMVQEGELEWPTDTKGLRFAHAYAFQYEAMRSIIVLKAELGRYNTMLDRGYWGVVTSWHKSKTAVSKHLDTNIPAYCKKSLPRNWYRWKHHYEQVWLGSQAEHWTETRNMGFWAKAKPKNSKKALYKKLFGTNQKSLNDIQLKLPKDFLVDRSKRAGWGI